MALPYDGPVDGVVIGCVEARSATVPDQTGTPLKAGVPYLGHPETFVASRGGLGLGASMDRADRPSFDTRTLLGRFVAPLVGMAFFWGYFRYQIVFMVLYPQHTTVSLGFATIPAHGAFLLTLALLTCAVLILRKPVEHALRARPLACAAVAGIGGTAGALLALAAPAGSGDTHAMLLWLSTVLVGGGFLASFLGWAYTLSRDFSAAQLVVLSASYLLSLVMFRLGTVVPRELFPVVVALGSSLLWLVEARLSQHPEPTPRPSAARALLNPSIWLFAAFLLAGSVIRGIVDCTVLHMGARRALSTPITALLVGACLVYLLVMRRKGSPGRALPFVLGCWVGFAALFFCGIFLFLVSDDLSLGGGLVVIARSMLEVVLWMFLCDFAHRRRVPVVPLFVLGGVLVETASWAISYVLVPALIPAGGHGATSPQTLALIAIFGLVAVITVACGVLLVLQSCRREGEGLPEAPAPQPQPVGPDCTAETLERAHGLTPREATVALLYSRGYSLSKVAEEMGVSTGSAQTSIKSAYRKLDVHSKDELIGVVESLQEG